MESRIRGDQFEEVVVETLLLDTSACFHGQLADPLVEFLSVAAQFDSVHHNILSRHEGKLGHQALLNDLGIDLEAVCDVETQIEHAVDREKAFRDGKSLVGGIVQGSLKPLGARSDRRIEHVDHHIAGKGADALAAHGISLVGHRA